MHQNIKPSSTTNKKSIHLEFDLGNLSAFNISSLDTYSLKNNKEEYIMSFSKDNIQILLNKIFSLPKIITLNGSFIELPEPVISLPREKPIPKSKPETKWEKFAKAKGIKSKSKIEGKMIYDRNKKKWVPKWGYKGKNKDLENQCIIEINNNNNRNSNQRILAKSLRKERIRRNQKQSIINSNSNRKRIKIKNQNREK
ncbi:hypothetical protein T552_00350 [Pneumocystis carinii B80]|uniref:Ribosome biogenesis regulatory protein n=1 Tax=Pneumocystis carinii (strain B80) TaxID=1408658 RepID=A0A0W4ZQI7_PNEC8|nr:hypothetical protein T552_00350 [Pneumocystis carinii B80]KTW30634.1 hypothetical protein T552_00350 [Pneumocystis carinii B80]